MSKTIAQLARLLGAANEQLFDRYINFRLTRKEPVGSGPMYDERGFALNNSLDFQVTCPLTGLKPDITLSATLNVQETSHLVTLTVINMSANIDTMIYNWAEIEVGYYNSGIHTRFKGQITNCYMAKPNPNGELVVSVVCSHISDLFAQGDFEVTFLQEKVPTSELVNTCLNQIVLKVQEIAPFSLPKNYTLYIINIMVYFYSRG